MRFLWRFLILVLLIFLLKNLSAPQPQAFIAWPEENFIQKIKWEVQRLQQSAQDLPASIEVQIRKLLRDFKPDGNGKQV